MTTDIFLVIFLGIMIFLGIIIFFGIIILLNSIFNSIFYGVPQVGTFKTDFEVMKVGLKKYNLAGKKIIDLGSGTGKSLRFFEKYFNAKATGYEVDFANYLISIILNKIFGMNANVKKSNFLKANLVEYDFIYIYLYPELMENFRDFIFSTSKKGTIIFSNTFKFKDIYPIEILLGKNGKEEIFVYEV